MSGPARTAEICVKLRIKITDNATEGEMLDAVYRALAQADIGLQNPNGTVCIDRPETVSVITKGTGGHL